MDNYHVVGDPNLAPPVPPSEDIDASEVSYNSETVEDALDKSFMDKSNFSAEPADMNDIVSFGTHTINPDVTTLNVPISGRWAFVEVFRHGTSSLTQLWVDSANEYMYTRTRSGNPAVWSSWRNYEQLVTFSDLSKYGIATSGEKINATLQEICKKVPSFCEVKIWRTGNDINRFGTLANQIPETYGALYIHKTAGNNPCAIEFIAYASGSHYVRNFDSVNADHLSEWINLNTVGYAIASNEPTATSSRAYSVGQYMVRDGRLKKVTSAIASGESITGNNTSNTTVGDELRSKITKFANGLLAGWSSYQTVSSTGWTNFFYGGGIIYSGSPAMSLLKNNTFRVTIYCNIQCTSDATLKFFVSLKSTATSDSNPWVNAVVPPAVAITEVTKVTNASEVGLDQQISASCIIKNISTTPTCCLYYGQSSVSNAIKINNVYALWEQLS